MSPATRRATPAAREGGAIIVTFSMMLLFLIGFAAIAIDFGRLYIVRTELQTALDSCALAAAQELDGQSTSITRATSAGITAGNLNNVNLQSPTWDGQGKLAAGDVSFKDANYNATTDPANARYVQCQHTQPSIRTWLLPALAVVSGNAFTSPNAVAGTAVATRANAQSSCPVPVGLRGRTNTPPNYGFQVGEWVTIYGKKTGAAPGEMGWYNLDGSTNASETTTELSEGGVCGVKIGDVLGTPGAQSSVDVMWNRRFGIYKNGDSAAPISRILCTEILSNPSVTAITLGRSSPNGSVPPTRQLCGTTSTLAYLVLLRAEIARFTRPELPPVDSSLLL